MAILMHQQSVRKFFHTYLSFEFRCKIRLGRHKDKHA